MPQVQKESWWSWLGKRVAIAIVICIITFILVLLLGEGTPTWDFALITFIICLTFLIIIGFVSIFLANRRRGR